MRLYVGNLPFNTTEQDLQAMFEAHGTVVSTAVVTDRETGRSRGFGFVEMGDKTQGQAAIEALNGQALNGRNVTVNEARPREERAGGGGGGRGGRGGYGGGGSRDRGGW